MTKKTLVIAIPIVAVVLNGVGYLIYKNARTAPRDGGSEVTHARIDPPAGLPGLGVSLKAAPAKEGVGQETAGATEATRERQAQARRAAGLVALEAGEYDKALINFTEAKVLIGDKANVADLLQVTQELRRTPPVAKTRPAHRPAEEWEPSRKNPSRGTRRVAVREAVEEEPAPSAAEAGLLIVSTTPRGILVHVDDTPVDLTPMKTKVKAGSHRVSLYDGDRKVFETSVEVKEGGTATLVHDLSSSRVAETPSPVPAPAVAPATTREDAPRPMAGVAAAPAPSAPAVPALIAPLPATPGARSPADRGTLDISVPGLYGVVWVNGRPRGYPPLAVPDLPAGPAEVEVRVNGVQKRSTTAMVRPGLTTSVKLRSQANP
jgi:hypothetical protein